MSARQIIASGLVAALLVSSAQPTSAAEPLADKVRAAIDKGIGYLKKRQENRGGEWNWENTDLSPAWPGGSSCLATLALLTCGVKTSDEVIRRGLPYIRGMKPKQTYVIALQTMVLSEVGEAKDLNIIQGNVNWLLDTRIYRDNKLTGWSYHKDGHIHADNSNTQYALLGLLAGRQAGIKIAQKDWKEIQDFYISTQLLSDRRIGGWPYRPDQGGNPTAASHTMTTAGLSGLFISGLELNVGQQELDEKTGVANLCGKYRENEAIAAGMKWLGQKFSFDMTGQQHSGTTFYNIYGIERVGRLSGQRFIGEHDWYREGCEKLCGVVASSTIKQRDDGSWQGENSIDRMPVLSTSFALLFLSKGRTPILISKLAFDTRASPDDWNRKHHDARNLVDYASKALFKKQTLAWQVFDPRLADLDTPDRMNEELSNLLQSPILYMNGHGAPKLSAKQIEMLRRYVEEGGFIFAEACCGDKAFADGFTALMEKVFKESPLVPMRADHPIWSAHMPLDPTEFIAGREPKQQVQCIERGCKTVVVFTPQPLAGFWEEIRFMPESNLPPTTRGELAYRFAGNVIAYATGLEMPKPRLTKVELTDRSEDKGVSRYMLKLAQLKHDGDWHPAPMAMHNLAAYLLEQFKLDVARSKEEVRPSDSNLMQYKFMYMHGRREFTMEDEELKNIRNNLHTGGMLFADACCGSKEFDRAFRSFAAKLYPGKKLERIPLDDVLYSEKLSGKAITSVKCRREKADGSATAEYEEMPPELEGVKIDNRWVIIYSKYDIGCALEKNKSSACKGHDPDSARILGAAAVLYSLRP